jgi:protein gp37
MSDLFGRWVSDAWLDACVATMAATPRHLHMLLTKRPERMRTYFEALRDLSPADRLARIQAVGTSRAMKDAPRALVQAIANLTAIDVPLFRVILGTSVENQDTANARLPELLLTPAWQRFVSYEPALGSVTFRWAACTCADKPTAFKLKLHAAPCPLARGELCGMLHRIIYGGESGPGARPNWLMWPASVIRQGQELRIPVFIKQLGAFPTQTKIGTDFFEDHPTKVEKLALTPAPGHKRPARKGNRPEEWPIVENAKGEPIDLRVRE